MTTLDLYDTDDSHRGNRPAVVAGLKRLWATHNRNRAERKAVITLSQFDDHLLRDIGIEPQDVADALRGRRAFSILFDPMRRRMDDK